MVDQCGALLLFVLLVRTGLVVGCVCPAATVLTEFPSQVPADVCCLNFSGSAFIHVRLSVFNNETNVQILDLSNCNISSVEMAGKQASTLQNVYLNHNRLTVLPREFLASQPRLVEVDLSDNMIQELPEDFLQDSDSLQKLSLQGNLLHFLPGSVLQKPLLQRLELDGNLWDCSCSFLEGLEDGWQVNRTVKLQELVGNITCLSPRSLAGRVVWSVKLDDICRPAGLTALFITLPLLILSTLVLCWCCGRKTKKKETPAFNTSKKRTSSHNGLRSSSKDLPAAGEQIKAGGNEILKNPLLLRPSAQHLGSTRDIYEEVEVRMGSVESIPRGSSRRSSSTEGRQAPQEPDRTSKTELDTVSVTEVMKDSADREKAYMNQSTEYYSLVPGIELDDSDHGEYENIDLS
ncbi:uncharacterized protein ACBR49_012085 [Aulostomus maculatus]